MDNFSQAVSILLKIGSKNQEYFSLHNTNLSCHFLKVIFLDDQQDISFAICTYVLLDEFVSKSSDDRDSSLGKDASSKSSTSESSTSSLSLISCSSTKSSEMFEVISGDSTFMTFELFAFVV